MSKPLAAGARGGDVTTRHRTDTDDVTFTVSSPCCSRVGCVKYGLFVVNFLVWATGGVLMGVGTWSRLERSPWAAFDNVTVDVAFLLIGIGAIMFVVGLFGCVGSLRESLCLLKTFIIAVVIVFVIQMVAGILAFVMMDKVENNLMELMKTTVSDYGTSKQSIDVDKTLDKLQKDYMCCGGASYQDWDANPVYNCSSGRLACQVPPSCCLKENGTFCVDYKVRRFSEDFAKLTINTRGCIGALMSIFKDNLIMIGLIAFAVGFLQVCSLLMAHCLMRFIVTDLKNTL